MHTANADRVARPVERTTGPRVAPARCLAKPATVRVEQPPPQSGAEGKGREAYLPSREGLEDAAPKVSVARHNKIKSNPGDLHGTVEPDTMR